MNKHLTLREAFDKIAPASTLNLHGHDNDVNFPHELVQNAVLHTLREIIESYFYGMGFISREESKQCADAYIQAWFTSLEQMLTDGVWDGD